MSAHVLLNLLNEFVKRDKMRGLHSNNSELHNDTIYHIRFQFNTNCSLAREK